jgi:hypothetical protein
MASSENALSCNGTITTTLTSLALEKSSYISNLTTVVIKYSAVTSSLEVVSNVVVSWWSVYWVLYD